MEQETLERMLEMCRRMAQTHERMLEVSRRMAETRQLDPLLKYAMREAIDLVDATHGILVLVNEDGSLDFRLTVDRNGDPLENPQDQVSYSIINRVIETRRPVLIEDALNDPGFATSESVANLKLRSVMCVPLISRGNIIGALFVENRSAAGIFEPEDLTPLIFFANQVAVSIENALINDSLEQHISARTADLEKARAELEQSWREAVEVNRLRTLFLGNVAHDIRAPMSVAITALSMLQDGTFGPLNDEQMLWVTKAMGAVEHAVDLINDMFDLTKAEMGQLRLETEPIALTAFLEGMYEVGSGLPWPAGVSFEKDIAPDLPEIDADPVRLRQVLLNLLTNAIKFTQAGSVLLYARRLPEEKLVLIGVKDTGIGIPAHKLEDIFDRFHQVDPTPTRRQKGTGLGLAICRELIELHGGRIWVESAEGQGADFKFTLPVGEG
ncbi:MAG: hypothetical protein Kow00124_23850 [Anaerolineae bacterium]